ncbi:hypothetical protein FRC10_009470, partial [Ceratobasidium sp. 414]
MVMVLKEPPARPEAHIPSGSRHGDALWLLLKRCWANEPEERPKASEVAEIMHGFCRPSVAEKEGLLKQETGLQDMYDISRMYGGSDGGGGVSPFDDTQADLHPTMPIADIFVTCGWVVDGI